jgi:glycosyltransferase involved in cell wall biosynthesis
MEDTYIIAVGRMNEQKQFDVLIEAYSKTVPKNGIKLKNYWFWNLLEI